MSPVLIPARQRLFVVPGRIGGPDFVTYVGAGAGGLAAVLGAGEGEVINDAPELVLIDRTEGTIITNFGSGTTNAFDGNTNQAGAQSAIGSLSSTAYIGKTLAAPRVFGRAVVHGSNNNGFTDGSALTINVYGKNGTAPANATDGTLLATMNVPDLTSNESAGRTIDSDDLVNAWDHLWINPVRTGGSGIAIAELVLHAWE